MNVLTKNYGQRQEVIITDCFVMMPYGVTNEKGERRYCRIENAAWDTGATNTIISPEIVMALGLKPSGKCQLSSYGNDVEVNSYIIDLGFQNGYKIINLQVLSGEAHDNLEYDVLIRMDVITKGDFCVTTIDGKTSFFFRMPAEGFQL